MIRRSITRLLVASTFYLVIQYTFSIFYGLWKVFPENSDLETKHNNPFTVPSVLLFSNGTPGFDDSSESKDDAKKKMTREDNNDTLILPPDIVDTLEKPTILGSFQMLRNETLEMERAALFGNGSSTVVFPTRDVFMRNDKPTPNTKFLLDYVVAGFPKCGTTSLGEWLGQHHEIKSALGEKNYYGAKPSKMITELYQLRKTSTKVQQSVKIGFRCPVHIQSVQGIKLLNEPYFSETKIIVSVRHPVKWFESYYNYRIEQNRSSSLLRGKTPNELIGTLSCKGCNAPWMLSTAKGAFHYYLSRLMKTPMNTTSERNLLTPFGEIKQRGHQASKNKIFFLEMTQLGDDTNNNDDYDDDNETRQRIFRKDMQEFLGLQRELTPILHVRPSDQKKKDTGQQKELLPSNGTTTTSATNAFAGKVDLCDDDYTPVRDELMRISRNASIWFRHYFLKSEDVFTSSKEYLVQLLDDWMIDPCSSSSIDKEVSK